MYPLKKKSPHTKKFRQSLTYIAIIIALFITGKRKPEIIKELLNN